MFRKTMALFVFSLVSVFSLGSAQEKPDLIDEKAVGILREMSEFLSSHESLSFNACTTNRLEFPGVKQDESEEFDCYFKSPGTLAILQQKGRFLSTVICNGNHLYVNPGSIDMYSLEQAPQSSQEMDAFISSYHLGDGNLKHFLKRNPFDTLMDGVIRAEFSGVKTINGIRCNHLKLHYEHIMVNHYIEVGNTPYPRRFEPDNSEPLKRFKAAAQRKTAETGVEGEVKLEYFTDYSNWQHNVAVPADILVISPPESKKRLDSYKHFSKPPTTKVSSPLIGKRAPNFKLKGLKDNEFVLSEWLGKNVIVLDFWATWCGPCQKGTAILSRIAEKLDQNNITILAINLREGKEKVQKFVQQNKLKIPVLLDTDGSIGKLYGVNGIPHLVIIDKCGKVHTIHRGLTDNFEAEVLTELKDLM